jgi:DNA-binding NtrC family response regulator
MIERLNRVTGNSVQPLSKEVQMALNAYDWPENLKELENVLERLVIMKEKGAIELADLPNRIFQKYAEIHSQGAGAVSAVEFPRMVLPKEGIDLKAVLTELENHLVDQALARTHGNKNKASTLLGLNRTTLVEKLRKRGMIVPAKTKRPGMTSDEMDAMMK